MTPWPSGTLPATVTRTTTRWPPFGGALVRDFSLYSCKYWKWRESTLRAVWCEMLQSDSTWSRPRLVLATETDLSARAVVEIYGERWGIEPLFHNLKRWWGVTNLWQQSKEALELWMQIRSTAYALTQLLALRLWESFPLMDIAPWRKGAMITAGLFG